MGGLGRKRQEDYLTRRGWRQTDAGWLAGDVVGAEPLKLSKAVHHQLTRDLCAALAPAGWKVVDYSPRGYAKLEDPTDASRCSLPAALRRQAKREQRRVGDFTYALFLAAMLEGEP